MSYTYTLKDLYNNIVVGIPSDVTKFLFEIIQSPDYRGVHLSQHNRYTKDEIFVILKELYDTLLRNGLEKLPIRTTDLSKRPCNNEREVYYAQMVRRLSSRLNRVTQDSLRKNFYVDMARMGFIDRFDSEGKLNDPFCRLNTDTVNITEFGKSFLKEYEKNPKNIFEINRLWTIALNNLHNGFETQLYEFMLDLQEYNINSISYDEFAFFASKVSILSQGYLCRLIIEFKKMSRYQRHFIIEQIQQYANPSKNLFLKNLPDKTYLRDYRNWINEAQQLFYLLKDSVLFNVSDFRDKELNLRTGRSGLIDDYRKRLKRSQAQKKEYFSQHSISVEDVKGLGFELHHIIPLLFAKNHEEFKSLDVWENMILIDGQSHAVITQNGSKNIALDFHNADILFKDFKIPPHIVKCIYDQQVKYNVHLRDIMLSKNQELLCYL